MLFSYLLAVIDVSGPPKPHLQIQGQIFVSCQSYTGEMIFQCDLNLMYLIKSKVEKFCLKLLKCHLYFYLCKSSAHDLCPIFY